MPGLLSNRNEDITITRKLADGTSMTIKSPNGSQMEMSGLLGKMIEGPVNTMSSRQGYQGGGLIGGAYHGPTHDNVPISANPGEFVMNVPASQNPQFRPVIEQMNQWGRKQLAMGGYTNSVMPMGYNQGGAVAPHQVPGQLIGTIDQQTWSSLDEAGKLELMKTFGIDVATGQTISGPVQSGIIGSPDSVPSQAYVEAQPQNNAQQYPPQVVLDPSSTDKGEFDRMDQLVRNGIYTIQQDRAGRAIYQLSDTGRAHNVRSQGSGVVNRGVNTDTLQPRPNQHGYSGVSADPVMDNFLANLGTEGGRGSINEAPGARADVAQFGQAGSAPTHTPSGSKIRYRAGEQYNVATKEQAMQFVAAGIVAKGAMFVLPDGTTGRAM